MAGYSHYIVFVDESGDHSLVRIDEGYPVFVLACCLIEKKAYMQQVVPQLQAFKFKHFGHDAVVLHEREIRRDLGSFSFLKEKSKKEAFINELTEVLEMRHFVYFLRSLTSENLPSGSEMKTLARFHSSFALSECTMHSKRNLKQIG